MYIGGGNEGKILKDTHVDIRNATITGSIYAGGNGVTASVGGNTNLNLSDGTVVGNDNSNIPAQGSVFGGGNAATTGIEGENTSVATVNVVGGKIYGNLYGGANTSVVYGKTDVNIGFDSVEESVANNLLKGDIYIKGTIFGGGEANAEGSEVYDFSFISVTDAINININGRGHNSFDTEGSIFGSGNASSTSGISEIRIKNYGIKERPGKNISIQRANTVILDNSHISLSGATDRTNEYSNVYFSISRVDHLKSTNNSYIYMAFGSNLLKKYSSLVSEASNILQQTNINEETGNTETNVDNRIYMLEGKNLNIATNESVTTYGEVNGMTFFGIYTNTQNPATSTGLYHYSNVNGDEATNIGTFSYNSYILAEHKVDHDITKDGFYTNVNNEGIIKTEYVGTTPDDDLYYIWLVGEALDVTTYEITLTGSKYATLGTYELPLTGFSTANTKYKMAGFSVGLNPGIELIHKNDIPPIALTEEDANSKFGLSLKTSRNGWKKTGELDYFTADGGTYEGIREYASEDSNTTPSFLFYFYHSQNLSKEQELGDAKIRFQVLVPVDDLNYEIKYIDINITMLTALYQDDFYETSITPGEEFELFTTTETNITNKSVFSTYFSLYIPEFTENKHYNDFSQYRRVLVSRKEDLSPFIYPEGTTITMLDMVTNISYYYIVTAEDEASGKYEYYLTDFMQMGTTDNPYNEATAITEYIDEVQNLSYENFIFHTNFETTNIINESMNNSLLMELRDDSDETLIGVLGIARDRAKYSIYVGKESNINLMANISPSKIYLGDIAKLDVTTQYNQAVVNTKKIFDTRFFDKKMGLRIVILNSQGNQMGIDSLLGIKFIFDEKEYMPAVDGSVRIKVADTVSNTLSRIKIDTRNNKILPTDEYKLHIESFGSPDGIYYGAELPQSVEVSAKIIHKTFGIKVRTADEMKIIDKTTGKTENENTAINIYVDYESMLLNPKLKIHLERRKYDQIYGKIYEKVDLQEYLSTILQKDLKTEETLEYVISESPVNGTRLVSINMKEKTHKTGTYRIVVSLYDNNKFIGSAYEYIVIK